MIPAPFSGRGKANGAGIAADPTLTDAWSCPKTRTWHPMFSLLSIRRCSSGSVTGARTGIRFRPAAYPVECARSEDPRFCPRPASDGRHRDRASHKGRSLSSASWIQSEDLFFRCFISRRPVGPIHKRSFLRSVIDPLASDRSLQHVSLWKHMDSFFHVFPVWIFSLISSH